MLHNCAEQGGRASIDYFLEIFITWLGYVSTCFFRVFFFVVEFAVRNMDDPNKNFL